MDYLKEKKDSFRRKQLRVFLNNLCVDNESILCQIWDNIHILLGAEKQALTKHPIRGGQWFIGIKYLISSININHDS